MVEPSPVMVPGKKGQFVTGVANPAELVKKSWYVAAFELTNEIVLALLVRAMLKVVGGGGGALVAPVAADGVNVNLGVEVEISSVK